MATTVVVNCHMHRMVAKKARGFSEGFRVFFQQLAENIRGSGARVAVGDWNMSLWVVADELRQRGIECTIGAMFAWRSNLTSDVMCDSMGIFLCGPVSSVRVLFGPGIFEPGDETELLQLNKGQGYVLSCYLPHGGHEKVRSSFHIRGSGGGGGGHADRRVACVAAVDGEARRHDVV